MNLFSVIANDTRLSVKNGLLLRHVYTTYVRVELRIFFTSSGNMRYDFFGLYRKVRVCFFFLNFKLPFSIDFQKISYFLTNDANLTKFWYTIVSLIFITRLVHKTTIFIIRNSFVE